MTASVDRGGWEPFGPGIRRRASPPGPWFQYRDPVGFEWNAYELAVPGLPAALDGLRVVHLSDLHCVPQWQTAYDDLFDRLNADPPELTLITGDLVDHIWAPRPCVPTALRFLRGLRAKLGVFGIRGNHDQLLPIRTYADTPMRNVEGRRVLVRTPAGCPVELIGTPGPERVDCPPDFARRLPPPTAGVPRIVLSHFPDHFRRLKHARPDLYLAGHTHGGQVCLPGRVPILKHDSMPIRYWSGVHRLAACWYVVSRGIGFSSYPARLFCPSEVIDLTLRSA